MITQRVNKNFTMVRTGAYDGLLFYAENANNKWAIKKLNKLNNKSVRKDQEN